MKTWFKLLINIFFLLLFLPLELLAQDEESAPPPEEVTSDVPENTEATAGIEENSSPEGTPSAGVTPPAEETPPTEEAPPAEETLSEEVPSDVTEESTANSEEVTENKEENGSGNESAAENVTEESKEELPQETINTAQPNASPDKSNSDNEENAKAEITPSKSKEQSSEELTKKFFSDFEGENNSELEDSASENATTTKNQNKKNIKNTNETSNQKNDLEEFLVNVNFEDMDTFRQRFSFNIQPNGNLVAGEYKLARNLNLFWMEGFVQYVKTQFDSIAENKGGVRNSSTPNPSAEINMVRPRQANETLTLFGLGGSYIFPHWEILDLFHFKNLYHGVGAYGVYYILDESFTKKKYQGYGYQVEYSVHKRIDSSQHIGFQFAYHWGMVSRDKVATDTKEDDRRLYLIWPSIGINYGFYF